MVSEIESFGHLMIARRAGGEPVELVRSPDEVVFLAFDASIKRLVELHILRSGKTLDSVAKKSAFDRARLASELHGPGFMRILDVGEDQGLVYYTSNLNDGEFISDYILRRGPLQPSIVFTLVFQLLDDLLQLRGYRRVITQMRLDRVVMTTLEDTFLQLRIYDYGLSSNEEENQDSSRQVIEICELMFLMLTGKKFAGDSPDRYPSLTSLPMSLRTTMRAALTDPANCPISIDRLRDDVREAIGALVSNIQARNPRKQLVVIAALQPRSQLQDMLLENVPVETILGNRFRVEGEEDNRRHPFSIPCFNVKNDQPVTVHLLPPSRIVDKTQYEAVPLQMWRFNADKHPNILRSLSLWESPDWTFLTEEREPGFALSRLLAERISLNPQEVSVLLRQVQSGLEQAVECGVQRLDLHPSNIMLRVGKGGALVNRELDRLMQKRLDAWPPFQVKLRAHLTMRNLYEPPLVDKPEHGEHGEVHLADRDYRSRAFVALAAYLLTGQRQTAGSVPKFTEAVPEILGEFIRETLEQSRDHGLTPSPGEFLLQFEGLMHGTSVGMDLASRLRGNNVPIEEMESVGSVSDFEDEWSDTSDATDDAEHGMPVAPIARRLKATDFSQKPSYGGGKNSIGWPVWSAAAAVVLAFVGWWLLSGAKETPVVANKPASAPSPAVAQAPKPEPAPTLKPEVKPEPAAALVIKPEVAATKPAPAPVIVADAEKPTPQPPPAPAPSPAPTPAPKPEVAQTMESKPVIAAVPKEPLAVKPEPEVIPSVTQPEPLKSGEKKVLGGLVTQVTPLPAAEVKLQPPPVAPAQAPADTPPAPAAPAMPVPSPSQPPAPAPVPTPATAPTPPAPVPEKPTEPSPEIRKALLPSPEEIAKFKQGQVKPPQQLPAQVQPQPQAPENQKSGAIPTINVAHPMPSDPGAPAHHP